MGDVATTLWMVAAFLSAAACGYLAYRTAKARNRLAPMWAFTGGFLGFALPVVSVGLALLIYWWLGRPKEQESARRDPF